MRLLVRDAASQAAAALALAGPGVQIAIAGRDLTQLLATVQALRGAGADVWGELLPVDEADGEAFAAAARERWGRDFDRVLWRRPPGGEARSASGGGHPCAI